MLDRPIASIDRAALMDELRRMDAAKLYVYVRRVRMWFSLAFEWALERREEKGVTSNPAREINPAKAFGHAPVQSFAALAPAELPLDDRRRRGEDKPPLRRGRTSSIGAAGFAGDFQKERFRHGQT